MFPIPVQQLDAEMDRLGLDKNITNATIRQMVSLSDALESIAGEPFVHLELGNPGIPSSSIGVEAECEALRGGIANKYPNIAGLPSLKNAGSDFLKAFLNIDVCPSNIIPTVGSMQGSFTMMLLLSHRMKGRDTMLYVDPGFPAQTTQAHVLGIRRQSFDIFNYRGRKLEEKLEEVFSQGNIMGFLYSNPNNPAWTNFTEEELEIIGRLATKYDVIVLEDLAYMGMDFRSDFSHPNKAPYIPTVARYTDNYVLLVSGSKIFSYAGQRIAMVCISDKVAATNYPAVEEFFNMYTFVDAYVFGVLYAASSGTSHSAQYAMAAMLRAAVDGKLNFVGDCEEYRRRGEIARKLFVDNGFHLVYDEDCGTPISDGFFFTVAYGDMDSRHIQGELMRHGVCTISLPSTGSRQEGIRVCVSKLDNQATIENLAKRLKNFSNEFPLR